MKLSLDASAIIYGIEGLPRLRESVREFIAKADNAPDGKVVTSRLSWLECRVKPLRDGNKQLLDAYNEFFTSNTLQVIEISAAIVERATELRVRYGFKTPDAIHIATAMGNQSEVFLTGDRALSRCTELNIQFPG